MINLNDLTLGQIKEITRYATETKGTSDPLETDLIGAYVIVRCRDAGVHAGVLKSFNGRSCVLNKSRRLWYWKPADNKSFLSGVATSGLHSGSKVGAEVSEIILTEDCEIIACSVHASVTIAEAPNYDQ